MNINPFSKQKSVKEIDKTIDEVLKKREKDPKKTYALVCFHKKDKNTVYFCGELEGDAIKHKGTYYYVDSKRVYETQVTKGKNKYRLPYVDLYEGITVAFTPYEDIDTRQFSEIFQDTISLHIEKGILENKKKKQINLRKAIAIGLIAVAAFFILGK